MRTSSVGLWMVWLTIIFTACQTSMSASEIIENQERGEIIVQAIERHTTKTHHVPSQLELLRPEFLVELPQTTKGEAFLYRNHPRTEGYEVCFDITAQQGCCYLSRFTFWECTPGVRSTQEHSLLKIKTQDRTDKAISNCRKLCIFWKGTLL